jgi:hypothetical protein
VRRCGTAGLLTLALLLTAPPARAADVTLWVPPGAGPLKGVLAFTSVGLGPGWATSADFQALAGRLGAGIVAITNENAFGAYEGRCTGGEFKALLDAIAALGAANQHPELANAPIIGCGHSHGGDYWNYFNACYPERMALVFDKSSGGVQYSGAALKTPMIWEIGTSDLLNSKGRFRGEMLAQRGLGSPMTLVLGPGETHTDFTEGSRQMVIALIEAIFRLRVPAGADPGRGPVALNEIRESSGAYWLGDDYTKAIGAYPSFPGKSPLSRTSFLPDAALAAQWRDSGAPLPASIHVDDGACVTCYPQPAGEPPGAPMVPAPARAGGCAVGAAGGFGAVAWVLAALWLSPRYARRRTPRAPRDPSR